MPDSPRMARVLVLLAGGVAHSRGRPIRRRHRPRLWAGDDQRYGTATRARDSHDCAESVHFCLDSSYEPLVDWRLREHLLAAKSVLNKDESTHIVPSLLVTGERGNQFPGVNRFAASNGLSA